MFLDSNFTGEFMLLVWKFMHSHRYLSKMFTVLNVVIYWIFNQGHKKGWGCSVVCTGLKMPFVLLQMCPSCLLISYKKLHALNIVRRALQHAIQTNFLITYLCVTTLYFGNLQRWCGHVEAATLDFMYWNIKLPSSSCTFSLLYLERTKEFCCHL